VVAGKDSWSRSDVIALGILVTGIVAAVPTVLALTGGGGTSKPVTTRSTLRTATLATTGHAQVTVPSSQPVEEALSHHFDAIEKGHYAAAWKDLTGPVAYNTGGERKWIEGQKRSKLHGYNLRVTVRMEGAREANASVVSFRTYEEGHRWCFRGSWSLVKSSIGWSIYAAKLKRHEC
jgi:hypothetical protein